MASRAVDLLIAYRVIKLLVTPFEKQEAFKSKLERELGHYRQRIFKIRS